MMRNRFFVGIGIVSALSALDTPLALAGHHQHQAELQKLLALDPSLGQLPESLTMDDEGSIFMSMSNVIAKVTPGLALSTYATLPLPPGAHLALGVKVGPDDCLYNVSGAFIADPPGAFVWRICAEDEVELFATLDPSGFPNDLAFDEAGLLYVTDPFLGRIWRVDQNGGVEVWLDDPLLDGNPADPVLPAHYFGVDGIASDKHGSHLFVGNLDAGEVLEIGSAHNGSPGAIEIHASAPLLLGADGLAFDKQGTLYVAVNAADRLAKIDTCGNVEVIDEGSPLDAPSSLVFGTRPGDKKTLYLSSFAINRALGAVPGPPEPALLSIETPHRGLPLLD
jgi:sugar lactone lactonase YvrE